MDDLRQQVVGRLERSGWQVLQTDNPPFDGAGLSKFVALCGEAFPDADPLITMEWLNPFGGYSIKLSLRGEKLPIEFSEDDLVAPQDMLERIKAHLA
jgi:hypothetical protein